MSLCTFPNSLMVPLGIHAPKSYWDHHREQAQMSHLRKSLAGSSAK